MKRMIFSDIDGTLITSDLEISPKTQKAICQQVEKGAWFVPVSARMPEAIRPIMDVLKIGYPVISYNGALVQGHDGETLFSQTLPAALAEEICQFVIGYAEGMAWNAYSYSHWYSSDRSNFWVRREEEVVGLASEECTLEQLPAVKEVHKLLIMGDPVVIERLEKELQEQYQDLSIARSWPSYIEIMYQGVDKGQAVSLMAEHYGISLEDTIAFGDNFNDIPMLEIVGRGYVMGNGPEAVKERIGHVTADHNQDGIAVVLENW